MIIAKTRAELDSAIDAWKAQGHTIGFVPTMGALHAGHLSLCDIAAQNADLVVLSIFVNPTQFAPHEDLDTYPRTLEADIEKLEAQGKTALAYAPRVIDIYPQGAQSYLKAGAAAQGLESDFRPHFFDGVVSVVHTLFSHVRPNVAVFGEKDFQQLMVIREMVERQSLPITIIGGATARDEYGLALSSRNAYLSEDERELARMLNQIIYGAAFKGGTQEALEDAREMILETGFDKVDYIATRWNRVLVAAWLGKTRLIDNAPIPQKGD